MIQAIDRNRIFLLTAACLGSVGKATEADFQKDMAVVSHPGFNAEW